MPDRYYVARYAKIALPNMSSLQLLELMRSHLTAAFEHKKKDDLELAAYEVHNALRVGEVLKDVLKEEFNASLSLYG